MKHVVEIPSVNDPAEKKCRLRVAAYCRVSTQHEEQDSSLELQMLHYEKEIASHSEWVSAGVFSDRSSGLKKQRKTQFDMMMKKCRAGKIDLILTKSISRFGRNTLTSLKALQELETLGIDVFFEKENLWLMKKRCR